MAVFGLPVFGQRKEIEKQKIQGEEKEMKIIIVGCGKVGATLAEQLSNEGNDIVIVDKDAEKVQDISNACDIMGVVGSGSSHNVQLEAGIREANLLIAVTGSDELNLLCCLIAKKAGNGCQTIARVRNTGVQSGSPLYPGRAWYGDGHQSGTGGSFRDGKDLTFPICHQDRDFCKRTH